MGAPSIALKEGDVPRRDTLTRRASLTAVASLIDYTAKIAVSLAVTPFLVTGLGRSLYGVWEMLSRLSNYISAADGRPTDALRLVVASHQSSTDPGLQRRHVGSALAVWLLFLPIILTAGPAIVLFAPAIVKAAPDQAGVVRIAAGLLVLSVLLTGLAAIPEATLRGMNLGYKRMGLQAGLNVLAGLLMASAVAAGLGVAGLAGAQLAVIVFTGLTFLILARRFVPWFGVERPARQEIRGMLGVSVWLALADIIAKLILASDVLILGMVVAPAAVTTYVITGYGARTAVGVLSFTLAAAIPGLGGLIGRGERARAAVLRREILSGTWLLVTAIGGTILVWNHAFVSLWIGPDNDGGPLVTLLIVLLTCQTALIRADAYIIDAALQPRSRVLVGFPAAAGTIGGAALGAHLFGLPGLCAGVLAGRAIQSVAYPILARRSLGLPGVTIAREDWFALLRAVLVTAALFSGSVIFGDGLVVSNWVVWAAGVALTVTVMALVTYMLGLPAEMRYALRERVRRVKR